MVLGDVSNRSGHRKGDCALYSVGRGRRWRAVPTLDARGGLRSDGAVRTLRGCVPTCTPDTLLPTQELRRKMHRPGSDCIKISGCATVSSVDSTLSARGLSVDGSLWVARSPCKSRVLRRYRRDATGSRPRHRGNEGTGAHRREAR
eukprot:6723397-Prymnesium_polylepis.1